MINRSVDDEAAARRERWALPLLWLFLLAAYSNALAAGFIWDDWGLIAEQENVQRLAPLHTYFDRMFWSDPLDIARNFYRPLVTLSYALDYQLWDGEPWGFHLTNILLHLGVVTLVFRLARRTGASPTSAALVAGLFGALPRLTESVTWISGRTDVLASLFGVGALLAYDTRDRAWSRRILAAVLLLLGLLCKEVAFVFFLAAGALEAHQVLRHGRRTTRALLQLGPLLLSCAVYALLRLSADRAPVQLQEEQGLSFGRRILLAFSSFGHYLRMLADPLRPQTQIGSLRELRWEVLVLGVLGTIAVVILLWRLRHRLGALQWAAGLAAAAALGMVLHLVPLNTNVQAADRFLYVPAAMLAVLFALPVDALRRRWPRKATLALLLVLAVFAAAVSLRNQDWQEPSRFWRQALAEASGAEASIPSMQLALLLMDEGMYETALPLVQRSIDAERAAGNLQLAYNNLGVVLSRLGRHQEAIALFQRIVQQEDRALRARFNLVLSYARALRFDDAEQALREVERRLPTHPSLPGYRSLLAKGRETWKSLPAGDPGAPAAVWFERAQFFEDLTATHEAAREWSALLDAPDATREQLRKAAGVLVFNHDLPLAAKAVEVLAAKYPDTPELPAFRDHLEYKRRLLEGSE